MNIPDLLSRKLFLGMAVKHVLFVLAGALLIYHSVYFEPLEQKQQEKTSQQFNAQEYALDFWNNTLLQNLQDAVPVEELLHLFNTDMDAAVEKYGQTLGVSEDHSYLIRGQGMVLEVKEGGVLVSVQAPQDSPEVLLVTRNIFSQAVRDASGLLNVSDFESTMKFNEIGVALNRVVRDSVVPGIKKHAAPGKKISFVGAAEVNEDSPEIDPLEIIPIQVSY